MTQNHELDDKQVFINDLLEDYAVLHNIYIKNAMNIKQIYSILLGTKNALESGIYDDIDFEQFKEIVSKDLINVINKR